MPQAGRSRVRAQMRPMNVSILPKPFSRTMALRFSQPLTEISTRYLLGRGVKKRLMRKADNLTAIWEPIVQKMWDP
jgi:hypothetical protein